VVEAGLDWRISSATALGLTDYAAIGERSRDHALKGRAEKGRAVRREACPSFDVRKDEFARAA